MSQFDIFEELVKPGSGVVLHNVQLIDVVAGENGYERLIFKHNGVKKSVRGAAKWNEKFSRLRLERIGYLVASRYINELPLGACHFYPYADQTLRRVPELDILDRACKEPVGWVCGSRAFGFHAPVGLIPGMEGQFVRDESVSVTLQVPPEFVRECTRVQMSPEELLRSFVGDLAGITNYVVNPRADGYGSNGSDERDYAQAWLDRAHGMNAINLDTFEARQQEEIDRQDAREDFAALLDDFEDYGGEARVLFAAVQSMIDQQAASGSGSAASGCGYTCSADPEHNSAMRRRRAMAELDRQAWHDSFDEQGRYLDPESGFWESLSGEVYSSEKQAWFPADGEEADSHD